MSVEVTARHMDAPDDIQNYAREKGDLLIEEFPRLEHVHVILNVEKHRQIASVVVQAKNRIRTESKEASDSMRASIDQAMDKTERQLRRLRDKVQDKSPAMKHEEQDRNRAS